MAGATGRGVTGYAWIHTSRVRNSAAFGSMRLAMRGRGSAFASLCPIRRSFFTVFILLAASVGALLRLFFGWRGSCGSLLCIFRTARTLLRLFFGCSRLRGCFLGISPAIRAFFGLLAGGRLRAGSFRRLRFSGRRFREGDFRRRCFFCGSILRFRDGDFRRGCFFCGSILRFRDGDFRRGCFCRV